MINSATLAQELADSDLDIVGGVMTESFFSPAPRDMLTDADEDPGCQCCCCTGECREYYEYSGEELEALGFRREEEMDSIVSLWHAAKFWVDGEYTEEDAARDDAACREFERRKAAGEDVWSLEDCGYIGPR